MERMEEVSLIDFFKLIAQDSRISSTHICLYVTLYYHASVIRWNAPLVVRGAQIAKCCRISRRTYGRCMRDLMEFGYLLYEPSRDPAIGSRVFLIKLL